MRGTKREILVTPAAEDDFFAAVLHCVLHVGAVLAYVWGGRDHSGQLPSGMPGKIRSALRW
jgi:hypothetical protein